MLAVEDRRLGVVQGFAAHQLVHDVEPPVVGDHLAPGVIPYTVLKVVVEGHGVAAGDTLDDGVPERGWLWEEVRLAQDFFSVARDVGRPRTVEDRF